MKRWNWVALAVGTAVFLASCGGSSDGADTAPKTSAKAFKVFGDSIADSGTFGFKWTIQGNDADGKPFKVFPEIVAANLGVSSLCPFFRATSFTNFTEPVKTCTNFAVAGAVVNNPASAGGAASPYSILYQMDVASDGLSATDVVLVDGGGNDIGALIGLYLGATTPEGVGAFVTQIGTLVPAATLGSILGSGVNAGSLGNAAGAYADAAGTTLAKAVKTKLMTKGISKIVVLNVPDLTSSPRVEAILKFVEAQQGAAGRAGFQGAVRAWIGAYNAALTKELAGTGVQVFDIYGETAKVLAAPAQFGMKNITTPACPKVVNGLDPQTGLASLNAPATVMACNSASMSAPGAIPAGESADWWQHYVFADGFHFTPALNKLIAQSINLQLARAGWL